MNHWEESLLASMKNRQGYNPFSNDSSVLSDNDDDDMPPPARKNFDGGLLANGGYWVEPPPMDEPPSPYLAFAHQQQMKRAQNRKSKDGPKLPLVPPSPQAMPPSREDMQPPLPPLRYGEPPWSWNSGRDVLPVPPSPQVSVLQYKGEEAESRYRSSLKSRIQSLCVKLNPKTLTMADKMVETAKECADIVVMVDCLDSGELTRNTATTEEMCEFLVPFEKDDIDRIAPSAANGYALPNIDLRHPAYTANVDKLREPYNEALQDCLNSRGDRKSVV